MSEGFTITVNENVSALEVKELISKDSDTESGVVIFDASENQLCDLCYYGRSFQRVCQLICKFDFKNLEDISKKLKISGFEAESFSVRCIRQGKHDFESKDIEKMVGDKVDCKVSLKNPQKTLLAYVKDNKFYLGLDYSGFDMGKRSYKIFPHPASIRGDVAYCLIRLAGYSGKEKIVDPFCGSGTLAIEASLFSMKKSVHFHDKQKFAFLKFMKYEFEDNINDSEIIQAMDFSQNATIAARKNAKIAGANCMFTQASVDWLDTKFEEASVDMIATNPPGISKRKGPAKARKSYEEFFHGAKYVLKADGVVAIISKNMNELLPFSEKSGFKIKQRLEISGQPVLILKK